MILCLKDGKSFASSQKHCEALNMPILSCLVYVSRRHATHKIHSTSIINKHRCTTGLFAKLETAKGKARHPQKHGRLRHKFPRPTVREEGADRERDCSNNRGPFMLPLRGRHCHCQWQGTREKKSWPPLPSFPTSTEFAKEWALGCVNSPPRPSGRQYAGSRKLGRFVSRNCVKEVDLGVGELPGPKHRMLLKHSFVFVSRTCHKFLIARNFLHAANFFRDERGRALVPQNTASGLLNKLSCDVGI